MNTRYQNNTWEQQTELVLNIKLWEIFITVHELDVKILQIIMVFRKLVKEDVFTQKT